MSAAVKCKVALILHVCYVNYFVVICGLYLAGVLSYHRFLLAGSIPLLPCVLVSGMLIWCTLDARDAEQAERGTLYEVSSLVDSSTAT